MNWIMIFHSIIWDVIHGITQGFTHDMLHGIISCTIHSLRRLTTSSLHHRQVTTPVSSLQ